MRRLILIRHSLTSANSRHLYCGWTDIPLSDEGRKIAMAMRDERPLPEAASFASSDLLRARETLSLLCGDVDHEIIPRLREMNFGAFEMKSYEMLLDNADYIRWIEDKTGDLPCPGGESSNAFAGRVNACADALVLRDTPSMLIVCHGGVIAGIMAHFFPAEGKNLYQWQPGACMGYEITFDNCRPMSYRSI